MPDPKRDGATDANKGRTNPEKEANPGRVNIEKEADKGRVTLAGLSRRESLVGLAVGLVAGVVGTVADVVGILTDLRTFSPRQVGHAVSGGGEPQVFSVSMSARAGLPRVTFRVRAVPAEPPPTSRAGDRHETRSV